MALFAASGGGTAGAIRKPKVPTAPALTPFGTLVSNPTQGTQPAPPPRTQAGTRVNTSPTPTNYGSGIPNTVAGRTAAQPNARPPTPAAAAAMNTYNAPPAAAAAAPAPAPPAASFVTDPRDETAIADAIARYGLAGAGLRARLQQAALKYGDPNAMSAVGLTGTVNPDSDLAQAAASAALQNRNATLRREQAGTTLSSLLLGDRNDIAAGQMRSNTGAYNNFMAALGNYNQGLGTALVDRNSAINAAHGNEADLSIQGLPTIDTTYLNLIGSGSNAGTSPDPLANLIKRQTG